MMAAVGKKRKKTLGQWMTQCINLLLGAFCAIVIMHYLQHLRELGTPRLQRLLLLLILFASMYAAMLIQTVIHEAGHLLFGLLTGYRLISFRILNRILLRENGRIRCRKMKIAGTAGQCLMSPPELKNGRIPVLWHHFGGTILNAVTGAVFLAAVHLCPPNSFCRPCLAMLGGVGIGFALLNGVPICTDMVQNDGKNALDLRRSASANRAVWCQMKVIEREAEGVRTRDMPVQWFAVPTDEDMKNPVAASQGVMACERLMDEHRFDEADALMEHLLGIDSGMIGLHRGMLQRDRTFIELITQNRPDVLAQLKSEQMQKIFKTMKTSPAVLRTQYAYALLAENDPARAEQIRAQFETCAKTFPYPCEVCSERELMQIALERAEETKR